MQASKNEGLAPRIDRRSPLPLYYQLKEVISAMIRQNRLEPGTRLPGDHELCHDYELSRTVVRQALSELESEGLIERVKGRGTFVAAPKTPEGLVQSLTGLYEDVAARGEHLRSDVLRLEVVPADDRVAAELELDPRSPVIALERVRHVGSKTWVYTVTHLPYSIAPGLINEDLREKSLYEVLENNYGVALDHGRRSVEAMLATAHVAGHLEIAIGAPVLLLRSVSADIRDKPVESFVAYHRGDSSRFEVSLSRVGSRPLRPYLRLT